MKRQYSNTRHAWCEKRSCGWSSSYTETDVSNGRYSIFQEGEFHAMQYGHPVTVQKVKQVRFVEEKNG